ncbi:MAG: LTA synthase family protein [Gammaproteobacteria bacterium]|nr:LTA synthase family protein [Gammaproteobacteria bacterium]
MRLKKYLGIFKRFVIIALCYLAVLSASRLLLISIYWDRVAPTDGTGLILLQGLRFDIILLGMILGPVFLFKPWFQAVAILRSIGKWIFPVYVGLITALAFFVEASTASFIAEFDSRPNYLFVEYLQHPSEILATVFGTRPVELISFTVVAVLMAGVVIGWLRKDPLSDLRVSPLFCILATPIIAIITVAMIRSTAGHKPVNPSIAAFSQDSMVNQLPLNSPYSLVYAIYEQRRDAAQKGIHYGAMDDDEVLNVILTEAGIAPSERLDAAAPTLHHQIATHAREQPLNLVIILEESLGADFVGSLGGKDLTPELDELADRGIWLERLYATGTRSVRGIEALLCGFTPTAMRSVVKLGETQLNFFTLASLLERRGYQTSFVYGGESHFDNMRRFSLNNGFQTIIDQDDYEQPVFLGSWGVSDEDLFNRAHDVFSKAGEQPFFSLVFTSSNHPPFDIPENRVSMSSYGPRETAVKYADYALGRFIDMARQSNYWENTVFLIVADHSFGLNGGKLVPVELFRIPGLILGGTIEPRRISGIASQIDLLPTLLSLIGLSSDHPSIGRDLTLPEYAAGAGRALMQFHSIQAYIEEGRVVVLQPDLAPTTFRVDSAGEMVLIPEGLPALERKALAYALFGPMMIRNKAYFNYPDTR